MTPPREPPAARKLLKPIVMKGATVVPGRGRGKTIGIPTINVEISSAPKELTHGIYACDVFLSGKKYMGAMHFGERPAFKDSETLEVHIIDETVNDVPSTIDMTIVAKLRGVEDFTTTEALVARIQEDIDKARVILQSQ